MDRLQNCKHSKSQQSSKQKINVFKIIFNKKTNNLKLYGFGHRERYRRGGRRKNREPVSQSCAGTVGKQQFIGTKQRKNEIFSGSGFISVRSGLAGGCFGADVSAQLVLKIV